MVINLLPVQPLPPRLHGDPAAAPVSSVELERHLRGHDLVLMPFARRRGYRLPMSLKKTFIVLGFTGMTLHLGLENLGLVFTSASTAALVVASAPAVVAAFSIVMTLPLAAGEMFLHGVPQVGLGSPYASRC